MARKHRTRKMRGRQRRRTRRLAQQRGGDQPTVTSLDEWRKRVAAKIDELKRRESEQGGATYTFKDLASPELMLPDYKYNTLDVMEGGVSSEQKTTVIREDPFYIPYGEDSEDIRAIGAGLKELIQQAFQEAPDIGSVTPAAFRELAALLAKQAEEDKEYKQTVTNMQGVENTLRESEGVLITDSAAYPLYIWFLLMNTTVEPRPIPSKPVPQEPAAPAE